MKQFLTTDTGSYTFNAASKTVTFTGGITLTLKQILAIVNTTRNVIIYNPANVATGGTLSGQVLTLTYDTTAYANTDQLMIAVDVLGPTIFPAGFQRVTDEPKQIFYDPFDAALDTTNVWTTPTVGNSAVLASVATGTMSLGTGTTASGWSKLFSIPTFKLSIPAWTGFSFAIIIPDGAAPTANSYRFWGAGTPATTPTTAAPMTDAVGFELDTAGKLYAVVYAGGVRTQIADLSSTGNSTQPLNANGHRYIVYVRTDKVYWYIDGLKNEVASSNFQSPQIQTLPITLLAVGGSTPPASNSQIQSMGLAVWDTGKNATQLADGIYPFRKATISSAGALKVDNSGVNQPVTQATGTNLHTVIDSGTITAVTGITNALPTGANTIGTVVSTTPIPTFTTLQNAAVANGNGTTLNVAGYVTAILNVTASVAMSGGTTINFEASVDGTTWVAINAITIGSSAVGTTTTTTGDYQIAVAGYSNLRARISAYSAGTITIKGYTISEPSGNVIANVLSNAATGNGVTGTTVQRVTVSSDNTPFPIKIDQTTPGTTNLVDAADRAARLVGITYGTAGQLNQQAKGTQGTNALTVQDYKDSGRSTITAYAKAIAGAASETIIATWSISRAFGAPTASVTSLPNTTVTAAKNFRIQQISVSFVATTTTANTTLIQMRVNTAGAAVIGSNLVYAFPRIAWPTATFVANEGYTVVFEIPDGLEIPAAAGVAFTHTEAAANGTIDISLIGYEY